MIIFFSEQKFLIRFWNYFKYESIIILLVYTIFSIGHKSFDPFYYLIQFKLIFSFFIIIKVSLSIYRTINYIEKIEYNQTDRKIIFTINHFNKKEIIAINAIDLSMNLSLYSIFTRTSNYYLYISANDKCIVKQYNYYPWSKKKMEEIILEIKKVKTY